MLEAQPRFYLLQINFLCYIFFEFRILLFILVDSLNIGRFAIAIVLYTQDLSVIVARQA